jgi:hypothetical protein
MAENTATNEYDWAIETWPQTTLPSTVEDWAMKPWPSTPMDIDEGTTGEDTDSDPEPWTESDRAWGRRLGQGLGPDPYTIRSVCGQRVFNEVIAVPNAKIYGRVIAAHRREFDELDNVGPLIREHAIRYALPYASFEWRSHLVFVSLEDLAHEDLWMQHPLEDGSPFKPAKNPHGIAIKS